MFQAPLNFPLVPDLTQIGREASISELHPQAQLHLLRTLVQVKQAWTTQETADPHLEMGNLTDEIFWSFPNHTAQPCLLEGLGTFLVQVMGVLSQLAVSLTNGPHVADYVESCIRSVTEDDDFADTSVVSFLDHKVMSLVQMSADLSDLSNSYEKAWSKRPQPDPGWRLPAQRNAIEATMAPQLETDLSTMGGYSQAHPMNSTNLEARGKGKHICPYGTACDRGGVQANGAVIVFERNSAFR